MDQDRPGTGGRGAERRPGLIDWGRLARRLGVVAGVWTGIAVAGALITLTVADRAATGLWLGVGAVGLGVTGVAVVARSAFVGMLRAGDRGERLASDDVGLTPSRDRHRSGRRPERP